MMTGASVSFSAAIVFRGILQTDENISA